MPFSQPYSHSHSSKRNRQLETIDLRSPTNQRNTKILDSRSGSGRQDYPHPQAKGYFSNLITRIFFNKTFINPLFFIYFLKSGSKFEKGLDSTYDPREMAFPSQSQQCSLARGKTQAAVRPPVGPDVRFSAQERREKPERGDGRPNSKPLGMIDPYGIDIAPLNIFES